jgi:hypothetical protein
MKNLKDILAENPNKTEIYINFADGDTLTGANPEELTHVKSLYLAKCNPEVLLPAEISLWQNLKEIKFSRSRSAAPDGISVIAFDKPLPKGAFPALEHLNIDAADNIEVTRELLQVEKLDTLSLYAADDNHTLTIPEYFWQMPIRDLTVNHVAYESLLGFSTVETLKICRGDNPNPYLLKLAQAMPNLRVLEFFSCEITKISGNISSFKALEDFTIDYSGSTQLPDSISSLPLKRLSISNAPDLQGGFPLFITQLENLEELHWNVRTQTLPPELKNLSKLRILDLSCSLNNGEGINIYDKIDKFKPIPAVIGELTNLEELNLERCVVLNLDFIKPLKKLKKLSLADSAIDDFSPLSELSALEELSLADCIHNFPDLSMLAALPRLRSLDLKHTEIEDISFILNIKSLDFLNIERCNNIKDFSPLLFHPTLKKLSAERKIKKMFDNRAEQQNLQQRFGSPAEILAAIKTAADADAAEKAIQRVCLYADNFSVGDSNAITTIFPDYAEAEKDDVEDWDETIRLDELDAVVKKYASELSSDLLAHIVETTLRRINKDCYTTTIYAVREIVRRGDIAAQKRVVRAYIKSCEYYDAGHRLYGYTVQDKLIDDLFPLFAAEPLADLLEWCKRDHLSSAIGDAMDALFEPAFKNATETGNEATRARLEKIFANYKK